MLNKQIKEDKKRIRVLNSLFYPVFSKSKEKISAALEKQSITKSTHIIIIIHQFNHWFFVDLRKNRLNIYDSIRKSEESY